MGQCNSLWMLMQADLLQSPFLQARRPSPLSFMPHRRRRPDGLILCLWSVSPSVVVVIHHQLRHAAVKPAVAGRKARVQKPTTAFRGVSTQDGCAGRYLIFRIIRSSVTKMLVPSVVSFAGAENVAVLAVPSAAPEAEALPIRPVTSPVAITTLRILQLSMT